MALQQKVSAEVQRGFIGKTLRVLVEEPADGGGWIARSHADAPEIDGSILVTGNAEPGEFALVKITGATEYDLQGDYVQS